MNNDRIMILGMEGYIGRALCSYLNRGGGKTYYVTGVDNGLRQNNVALIGSDSLFDMELMDCLHFDITDYDRLKSRIIEFEPDVIVHLAEQPSAPFSQLNAYQATYTQYNNVVGTLNVLWAIKETNPNIHFIKLGTAGMYSDWLYKDIIIPERSRIVVNYQEKEWEIPTPRYGGSFYHLCYDDKTEILTRGGWKLFKDLSDNEEVTTLNQFTQKLEYQNTIRNYSFDFEGEMFIQKNRRLDVSVTPNHKLFVSQSRKNGVLNSPKLVEAKKLFRKFTNYLVSAEYDGEEREYFELPECERSVNKSSKRILLPSRRIRMDDWLYFLGWYISEGSVDNESGVGKYNRKAYRVALSTNYRKDLAKKAFIGIGYEDSHDNGQQIIKSDKQLAVWLRRLGKSLDKYIPTEFKNLSVRQGRILLDSLIDGDGTKNGRGWVYFTSSKKLADDVQELAIKCGLSANISCLDRIGKINWVKHKEYRVFISPTKTVQVNQNKNKEDNHYEYYRGKVYCCEVPNGVILVRKSGKPYFAGNSKLYDSFNIDYACRIWGLRASDLNQGVVYGYVYGTRFDYDSYFGTIINRFIVQAAKKIPLTVYGAGNQQRGFIHLQNSLQAIEIIIQHPPVEGEYRIIHQLTKVHSINEIANMVKKVSGCAISHIKDPRVEMENNKFTFEAKFLKDFGLVEKPMEPEIDSLYRKVLSCVGRIKEEVIQPTTLWR